MSLFWSILSERNGAANDQCYISHLRAATNAGKNGFMPLLLGYCMTDNARNNIVEEFMRVSSRDNDQLVMMDSDHVIPENILERFAVEKPEHGVVGALAFRRGAPYDPCYFVRVNGVLCSPYEFDMNEVYPCAIVGTGAISIRRWVIIELERAGFSYPWFKYEYPVGIKNRPGEDMYFGRICEQAGISHYVDTSIIIPHCDNGSFIDNATFENYKKLHPAPENEIVTTRV